MVYNNVKSSPITILFLVIYITYLVYLLVIQAYWPTTFCKYIEENLSTTCSATSILTWYSYIIIFTGVFGSILYHLENNDGLGKRKGRNYAILLFLLIFLKHIVFLIINTLSLVFSNIFFFILAVLCVVVPFIILK